MKQILIILLTISCSLITVNCSAQKLQGQARLDSLLAELPNAKEDTNKVRLLYLISYGFQYIKPDEGIKYGLQGLVLAQKLGWEKGLMWCNYDLGVNHKEKGNYEVATVYFKEALKWAEEANDRRAISNIYNNMGIVKRIQSDYPKALELYFMALRIDEKINKEGIPDLLMNIGNLYSDINNYPKAMEYYEQALKIHEEKDNKLGVASTLLNMSVVYGEGLKDYPKALDFLIRARKITEQIGDKSLYTAITINIGNVYLETKQHKMALAYFYSALQAAEEMDKKADIILAVQNIGSTYLNMSESDEAANIVNSLSELPVADLPPMVVPKGRIALLAEAEKYTSSALDLSIEIGDLLRIKGCYENLSEIYELQGNYKKSLDAHKEYLVYKDSMFNKENTTKIAKLEVKAEYEKQQLADSIVNAEAQKLAAVKLSRQRTFTFGGLGAALLLLAFSVFVFRNNKKLGFEKQKSEELLHNILPAEIASELKERGATTAQQYDNVTVLFTDFVDFTSAGEHMGSQALVEELHNCFMAFDDIMGKYGIEKIKTIGDAYLAVCGLPTANEHHAEKVVNAAQDIRNFMLQRRGRLGNKTFEVRIGVHSGEVVAGIVGVRKFAYDIWGDTVNTAARMESNSDAGKINISQTTYDLVKDKFTCTYRGEIEAKGKGMLKMYFVEAPPGLPQGEEV